MTIKARQPLTQDQRDALSDLRTVYGEAISQLEELAGELDRADQRLECVFHPEANDGWEMVPGVDYSPADYDFTAATEELQAQYDRIERILRGPRKRKRERAKDRAEQESLNARAVGKHTMRIT